MKIIKSMKIAAIISASLLVGGCMPSEIHGTLPTGGTVTMQFYPGGSILADLVIFQEQNYFGTAQYQFDDPLGDIGFRFDSSERVQAECILVGPDIIGQDECKRYEVYRSSWDEVPEGTLFDRPNMF